MPKLSHLNPCIHPLAHSALQHSMLNLSNCLKNETIMRNKIMKDKELEKKKILQMRKQYELRASNCKLKMKNEHTER